MTWQQRDARYRSEQELQKASRLELAARARTEQQKLYERGLLGPPPGSVPCRNPSCGYLILPDSHTEPIVHRVIGRVCIHGIDWPEEPTTETEAK